MFLILLYSAGSIAEESYCYWIRLSGLYVEQSPDFLGAGEYQPLIALEPGELYSLLPGFSEFFELRSKRDSPIYGHWYYVPAHMIDQGMMRLTLMMLDRDENTDDDLVLPMRSHLVGLDQGFSGADRKTVGLTEAYVMDGQPWISNLIRFRFELRRKPGNCLAMNPQAAALNQAYRKENRLHQLRTRIHHYLKDPLIAGWEANLFVEDDSRPSATAAYQIATRNLHEVRAIGEEVDLLSGTRGFRDLQFEFARLIEILREKRLLWTVYMKKKETTEKVEMQAPALASEAEWTRYMKEAVIEPIPKRWRLP